MADWNSLLDDPLFNAGIGLLGGAATPNPWAAAADQLNKYQTLRQNREAQQMHSKLYEAQSRREQEQADIAARKNKGLADFQSQYDPAATPQDQLRLGIKTGAIDPASALNMQYQQAELTMRAKEAAAARAEAQAATLEQRREAEKMRADAAKERVQMQGQFMIMARQIGTGNSDILNQLRLAQIQDIQSRSGDRAAALDEKKQAATDRATEKFSNQLQQAKIPAVITSVGELNNTLKQYTPDTVPGIGYAKNLPGASLFLSEEGKKVKSRAQAVSNDLLNLYSGLAVTLPEGERRALEQMSSGEFNAKDFYNAWPLVVKRMNATLGNFKAGYGPDVTQQYASRPGAIPLDPIVPATGAPNVLPPKETRVKGKVYDLPTGPHTWTGTGWLPAN